MTSTELRIVAPAGTGEIEPGADLAGLVIDACRCTGLDLIDGDIVVVTSKAVSKAEGRVGAWNRADAIAAETQRVVASRGDTQIVVSRLGLVHAAAGVDDSGVAAGQIALLPVDPDASADAVRRGLAERLGARVGVLISDTAGRPWREGQTDLCIGAAGLTVVEDHRGSTDHHGNRLHVTAMAVADELCAAAELATGKHGRRPFAIVRGRADLVVAGRGDSASRLQRPQAEDWFGYGAREAVRAAVSAEPGPLAAFGAPADGAVVQRAIEALGTSSSRIDAGPDAITITCGPETATALRALGRAHGWVSEATPRGLLLRLPGPVP